MFSQGPPRGGGRGGYQSGGRGRGGPGGPGGPRGPGGPGEERQGTSAATLAAMLQPLYERNQEATIYVGNLDSKVNEEVLWELFLQCGPVVNVHIPRDRITSDHQGYGFVEFRTEEDADYSIKIMHMVKLYGKPIKVNKTSQEKKTQDIGANLFVGNLHDEVDEKMLRDVFSAFGVVISTKIQRHQETGASRHYGFVSYDNFDSADSAITAMAGQYLCGKPIDVQYAFKPGSKTERHGSVAERILAANRPNYGAGMYNMMSTAAAYTSYLLQTGANPTAPGQLVIPPSVAQAVQSAAAAATPTPGQGLPPGVPPVPGEDENK